MTNTTTSTALIESGVNTDTKIAFASAWLSSPDLFHLLKRQTPKELGFWKGLQGVESQEDADCVVVLGNLNGYTSTKQIVHVREEPDKIGEFRPLEGAKVIDYKHFHAVTWWIGNTYDDLTSTPYPIKRKPVSTVSSNKWKHRSDFIEKMAMALDDFDVYGPKEGWGGGISEKVGDNYKGPLQGFHGSLENRVQSRKQDGIADYRYSLAIENSQQENYFTEKIVDCILLWSMPLYWGCPNVSDFFPEGSFMQIELNSTGLQDIIRTVDKPLKPSNIEALREARHKILNKYNIWEAVREALGNS